MTQEIKLRKRHFPITGGKPGLVYLGRKMKGGHNNQGTKGALRKARPAMPKGHMEEAHAVNEANQTVLVLLPNMKKRRMKMAEYEAYMAARSQG